MKVKFSVLGEPQGKGRPKFGTKGKFVTVRTPDETVVYENLIRVEYRRQCGKQKFPDNAMLDMRIIAYYTIPASASKKKQEMMESGKIRPIKKPDWDNICKVVADALNNIAYKDDAQIVDGQIRKFFSRQPRIVVTITDAQQHNSSVATGTGEQLTIAP